MAEQLIFLWRARLAIAAAFLAAGAGPNGAASAQSLEGEWSNTPSFCGQSYSVNNDDIHIGADGYRILESRCDFTGGTKVSSSHWVMRGTCSGEGPNPPGPEISIELRSIGGRLSLKEDGQTTYYALKCGEAAGAPARTYWDHNGSVMYLVAEGRRRRFFYSQPRVGIQEAGAQPNSLLFDGTVSGDRYDGTAFIFNGRCGTFPYHVSGPILDNYRRVVLRGSAPRVNANCEVTSRRADELVFILAPGQ
jgi:hypothetical protein